MLKVATLGEESNFCHHFVARTTPWLGLIEDSNSGTSVKVTREIEFEEITFRTQGELVASYRSGPDQDPLLQIFAPSSEVDLQIFYEKMKEIYETIPDLLVYLREGFEETPGELVALAQTPGDRAVMEAILAVEPSKVE